MVRREAATACVKFFGTIGFLQPPDKMPDDALMQLVEDIGGDRLEDVDVW